MTGHLPNFPEKSPRGRLNVIVYYKSVQIICQDGNEKITLLGIMRGDGDHGMVRFETEYERGDRPVPTFFLDNVL